MRPSFTAVVLASSVALGAACGDRDTTPAPPPPQMGDAIDMIEREDYAAAEPALERILREHRGPSDEIHHYLGVCAQARQDWADAEMHYREALQRNPALFESRLNLGNVLWFEGKNDESLAVLTELTQAFPEEPEGFLSLGQQQLVMGKLEESAASFRRVAELRPEERDGWINAADVLRQLGRGDERLATLQEGMERTHHDAVLAIDLARALVEANRRDEAVVTLVEASGANNNASNLVGAVALELRDMSRIDEALTVAQTGIDRATTDGEFRLATMTLALIARPNGRNDVAEAALRRGLDRVPGDRSMSLYLGGILAEQHRCDEAVPFLRAARDAFAAEDPAGRSAEEARAALEACGAAVSEP